VKKKEVSGFRLRASGKKSHKPQATRQRKYLRRRDQQNINESLRGGLQADAAISAFPINYEIASSLVLLAMTL
jgi:hypothetical protein